MIARLGYKGISPGSKALKNLFDSCGPCLILMDELVTYATRIYGVSGLPSGSFDNFITFIQEIDFDLLVSLGVFNDALMKDTVYKFKRYEDSSLCYTGIDLHEGEKRGGWDTVITSEEFENVFR